MSGSSISQARGGVPVAVPIQGGGDMGGAQTGAQGYQPQTVLAAASGMVGSQSQCVQDTISGAMATDLQLTEVRPSYGQGNHMPLENEQIPKPLYWYLLLVY